jgi:hypothetical protein
MKSKQQNFLKTSLPKKFKGGESEFIIFDMTLEYKSLLHELNTNTQIVINVGKKIGKVLPTSIVLPNIANVRIQGISTNEIISLHNCQLSHVK